MTREELLRVSNPILFSTPMVQAILDGRKSVTRRVIKLDLGLADTDKLDNSYLKIPDQCGDYHDAKDLCRYRVGDTLYVRETFRYVSIGEVDYFGECMWDDEVVQFKASQDEFNKEFEHYIGEYHEWKPSIHMPKELARIFLKVTDVRVERLQDITEEQARKEGCIDFHDKIGDGKFEDVLEFDLTAKDAFIELWNSTVKKADLDKYSWEANPFVYIIEFERVVVNG